MDLITFLSLQHPEEMPLDKLLERMMEEGRGTFEHELRLRSDEGQWLWFKMRGALATRDDPESWHMVGIAVDITAQKRAAAAMKKAERRLVDAIESIDHV
jgi:two-component system cell cycle sensor histidine kinase PleC